MTAPTDPGSAPRFPRVGQVHGLLPLPEGEGGGEGEPAGPSEPLPGNSHPVKELNWLSAFIGIPRPGRTAAVFICWVMVSVLVSGCHTSRTDLEGASDIEPLPPAFLSGPAGLLLTNVEGFSAHLVMTSNSLEPQQDGTSGELLGRAGKLLFAPGPGKLNKKYSRGGFSFIWDVATGHGTVLSEALQAYAPVSVSVSPTNLIIHPARAASPNLSGQAGEAEEAIVDLANGSRATFQLVRAADLKGFPLHISSVSNTPPFTLTFSKIRLTSPPPELFVPPNGFTKYESPEAMMTELIMRQHNLKRGRSGSPSSSEPIYDYRQRR